MHDRVKENPSHLKEMGMNARKYAEEHFSKQRVLPQLVELLESADSLSGAQVYDTYGNL